MDDLRHDTQTVLPTEYFSLCSKHFEVSRFSRSVFIGTPMDSKRFYLEKGSVPSIYAKPKDSLDTDYPKMREDLQIDFFPRNVSTQNPPLQTNRFLFGLGRLIRNMLSIFQDDRSTTLSNRMGLF